MRDATGKLSGSSKAANDFTVRSRAVDEAIEISITVRDDL
jgi:hypothetical protein